MVNPTRKKIFFCLQALCLIGVLSMYLPTFKAIAEKQSDFVHLWLGGKIFHEGHRSNLYDPELQKSVLTHELGTDPNELGLWKKRNDLLGAFWYPPITALLYAPLGAIPLNDAKIIMGVVTLCLVLVTSIIFSKFLEERLSATVIATLILIYPAFTNNFALGQNGVVTLFLLLTGALLMQKKHYFPAGLVWGCLIYKPTWLLSVIWIPVALGTWTTLGGMLLVCLTDGLVSIALFGEATFKYRELFLALSSLPKLPDYPLAVQYSLPSLFSKILGLGTTAECLGWASIVLILLVSFVALKRNKASLPITIALSLTAATLINPHIHHYDIMMAIIGILFVAKISLESKARLRLRLLLIACAAYSAMLIENAIPYPFGSCLPTFALILVWVTLLFLGTKKATA